MCMHWCVVCIRGICTMYMSVCVLCVVCMYVLCVRMCSVHAMCMCMHMCTVHDIDKRIDKAYLSSRHEEPNPTTVIRLDSDYVSTTYSQRHVLQ